MTNREWQRIHNIFYAFAMIMTAVSVIVVAIGLLWKGIAE